MSTPDNDLSFLRFRNVAGGSPGSIPYQTASTATAFIPIGSNTSVLTSNGTTATWQPITGKIIAMSMLFG